MGFMMIQLELPYRTIPTPLTPTNVCSMTIPSASLNEILAWLKLTPQEFRERVWTARDRVAKEEQLKADDPLAVYLRVLIDDKKGKNSK